MIRLWVPTILIFHLYHSNGEIEQLQAQEQNIPQAFTLIKFNR